MTRRTFLGTVSLAVGGILAGCAPAKILLRTYPDRYDRDTALRERMLAQFMCTVVPSARPDEPNLTRVFQDDFYPFQRYCGFFLAELGAATEDLCGHADFARLDLAGRTAVVERVLGKGGTTARIATGAVFLAEVAYYGGIYDDERGCPLIDFPGANSGYRPNTMTLAEIEDHLARPMTADGNPA